MHQMKEQLKQNGTLIEAMFMSGNDCFNYL